ncbi:MAG: tyrosine-type recombinase/integrase [Actinomycetota bacterium]
MTKRHNGEGAVRQRPNGLWEGRLSYVDADGVRRRHSFYGPTAQAVREQMKGGRTRVEAEKPVKDSTRNLGDYLEHWITDVLEVSDRAESTKDQYRRLARKHLIPALGSKPIGKVLKSDIEGLLGRMQRAGLSQSTRKSTFIVLRLALASAVGDKLIAANPAGAIATPQVDREEAVFLTPEQARALLAATEGLRYADALKLALATGMRRGEVAGLKWSDVNLEAGFLQVRRTLNRVDGKLQFATPKTKRSRRRIPLTPWVVTMLRAHKATQAAERLKAGELWVDEDLVFSTATGGVVDPRSSILRTVEIAAKKADIEGATVHALRHAAGSAMVDAGASLPVVRDILGHSSVSITGDVYSHVIEASTRAAVDGWTEQLGM